MVNHTGTARTTGIGNLASVLRHRNDRLLWIGTLVSNTGDWMDAELAGIANHRFGG